MGAEVYGDPCQISKMEFFAKTVKGFSCYLFSQKCSSQMFDRIMNTRLGSSNSGTQNKYLMKYETVHYAYR